MFYWIYDQLRRYFEVPKPTPRVNGYAVSTDDAVKEQQRAAQRQRLHDEANSLDERGERLRQRIQIFTGQRGS